MPKITYKCTNDNCELNVSLFKGTPVWREDTPPKLKMFPETKHSRVYITGFTSQECCVPCRKITNFPQVESSVDRKYFWYLDSHKKRTIWKKIKDFVLNKSISPKPVIGDNTLICPVCGKSEFMKKSIPCPKCKDGKVYEDKLPYEAF